MTTSSSGLGWSVTVDHGNGFNSTYAHLNDFAPGLAIGTNVRQGQLVGTSGNTGNSTGPHLHFRLRNGTLAYLPEPMSWYKAFGTYGACGNGQDSPSYVSKPPANMDYNGNGCADIMGRESPSGYLKMFPGPCAAGYPGSSVFYGALPIGSCDQLFGAGGYTPDGCVDVGLRISGGATSPFIILPGARTPNCSIAGFGSGLTIGSYWNGFSLIFSPRDLSGDGCSDVIARWGTQLLLYAAAADGNGNCTGGPLISYTTLPFVGWEYFSYIMGVGEFTGDGCFDLFGVYVLAAGGQPLVYPGNCNGSYGSGIGIGGGWNSFNLVWSPGDYDNDGCSDVIARKTDGTLWLYRGGCFQQTGAYWKTGVGIQIGNGWSSYADIF